MVQPLLYAEDRGRLFTRSRQAMGPCADTLERLERLRDTCCRFFFPPDSSLPHEYDAEHDEADQHDEANLLTLVIAVGKASSE